jgi:hypothetical protein
MQELACGRTMPLSNFPSKPSSFTRGAVRATNQPLASSCLLSHRSVGIGRALALAPVPVKRRPNDAFPGIQLSSGCSADLLGGDAPRRSQEDGLPLPSGR